MNPTQSKPCLIHLGNNNYANIDRILTVMSYKAITIKRVVREAEQAGLLLDFTGALSTRGIVLMDNGVVIRIPLRPTDVMRALSQLDTEQV